MTERIASITLDKGIKYRTPEVKHERDVAIADLLHDNRFAPKGMKSGPYKVHLCVREGRLVFDITGKGKKKPVSVVLAVTPFKRLIRDYFLICESYFEALKAGSRGKVEAIDAGRRGVHDEGADLLRSLLKGRISVDFATARRLFTLICVLHIK